MASLLELVDLLVCPESHKPLVHFPAGVQGDAEFLLCPASRLRYRIDQGLPIMLVEEAVRLEVSEVDRLLVVARARGLRVPG